MSAIPEKKTTFQKIVFTDPQSQYGSIITLISETECEIKIGGTIHLAEYSRQENKLRVVEGGLGGASVRYFDILPDGVRDSDSDEIYLLPEPLKIYQDKVVAKQRAEQYAAEARQAQRRAEDLQEQKLKEELTKRLIARRDVIMQDVRKFLPRDTVFNGTYLGVRDWSLKEASLPFQLTIIGDMTVRDSRGNNASNDSFDQTFEIPAHLKWTGDIDPRWTDKANEHDGAFLGKIEYVYNNSLRLDWRVTMQYFYKDDLVSGSTIDFGSEWNGVRFIGKSKSAIVLIRP